MCHLIVRRTLDDLLGDGQAEAGAPAAARVEHLEDALAHLLRDARPAVLHLDDDLALLAGPGAHGHLAAVLEHLPRVDEQVDQRLLELRVVEIDVGQERLEVGDELHAVLAEVGLQEAQHLAHDDVEVARSAAACGPGSQEVLTRRSRRLSRFVESSSRWSRRDVCGRP